MNARALDYDDHAPFGDQSDIRVIWLTSGESMYILGADWRVIAQALEKEDDPDPLGGYVWMKVRAHADGRLIVYGCHGGAWTCRGGEIVSPACDRELARLELVTAILRLGRFLDAPQHVTNSLINQLERG